MFVCHCYHFMSSLFHVLICAYKFYANSNQFVGIYSSMTKHAFLTLSELENGIYT